MKKHYCFHSLTTAVVSRSFGRNLFQHLNRISLLLIACICLSQLASSQSLDDYRTRNNGNWNTVATWSRYNGSSWVNATVTPNSSNGTITIRNNVTVTAGLTVDQVVINSGSTLIVGASQTLTVLDGSGTDMNVDGTLTINGTVNLSGLLDNSSSVNIGGSGALNMNANSTYRHSRNGGTIPTATWASTSTCEITGVTNSTPAGLGQSFANFTWNCTGQSSNRNFSGSLTSVSGNFNVVSTNTRTLYLTDNTSLNLNIGGDLNLSNGELTFAESSGASFTLNLSGDMNITGGDLIFTEGNNATATVNVNGSFSQSSGTVDFSDATQVGIMTMNVAGNFSQTGGTFDFASGTANVTRTPSLSLSGNFSQTGSGSVWTSTNDADITNGTITFNKSGTQTFSIVSQSGMQYVNYVVASGSTLEMNSGVTLSSISTAVWGGKFTINSGGTLNAKTYQILSSSGSSAGSNNAFTLSSGATIMTANANGIQTSGTSGTISSSLSSRTYSSAANYVYNGTVTQNSGIFTTSPTANRVNNLTVNNTGGSTGLTLQQPIAIAGTCYFTAGRITSSATNLLIFNDNAIASGANNNVSNPSYVNGPVRKIGNDAFTFPVGKSNVGYMPCGISAPSNTSDAFTAEYLRNSATALGPVSATGLYRVSACEYWQLDRTTGTSSVNVTLSWSGLSPCNAAAYVNDLATLVVAHFNGTSWNAYGNNGGYTGNGAAGTVTWNNVSTFSPFSLGSTSAIANPLPIRFSDVKAYKVNGGNKVEWKNETEENIERYEVERSADGTTFTSITSVTARSNNNQAQSYNIIDTDPLAGTNFYRVKGIEVSGSFLYSAIVKVVAGNDTRTFITAYPNPVKDGHFTIQLSNYERGNYNISLINTSGQIIMTKQLNHGGGSTSLMLNTPSSIKSGVYILQVAGERKAETIKLLVNSN